jgi:HD-GYP domain-containing protein (c-di-GMP phosphodiesterase class II)
MGKNLLQIIQHYPNYLDILTELRTQTKEKEPFSEEMNFVLSIEKVLAKNSCEQVQHAKNMAQLVDLIADNFKLSKHETYRLKLLARFHDIGKICLPKQLLKKLEPLTEAEWQLIKTHPLESFLILDHVEALKPIAFEALCHHENFDGTGYPNGLKGEEIPLFSRIIRVLDAYEVLMNGRIYQEPVGLKQAIEELEACKNKQFDPNIVDCFVKIFYNEKEL